MAKKILIFVSMLLMTSLCWGVIPTNFTHVIIVMEENHNYSEVPGTTMPYLSSLVPMGGISTLYYGNGHPSLGNYFFLTAGQSITCFNPACGTTNGDAYVAPPGGVDVPNVFRSLIAAGKTWKSYAQGLPAVGSLIHSSGEYRQKHNPATYFKDVVSGGPAQLNNLVPFDDANVGFLHDVNNNVLPNYSFVVPDLLHDAHDGTLAAADQWLSTQIDPVFHTADYLAGKTLVMIIWDESEGGFADSNTNGGGHVHFLMLSAQGKAGFQSVKNYYSHRSPCRTSLQVLNVTTYPGACATAFGMAEFFVGN